MIDYYNKSEPVKNGNDPFGSGIDDEDLTEETGSAGDTQTPGAPMPSGAVSSGADEILDTEDKEKNKK